MGLKFADLMITVDDLEATTAWFTNVLGWRLVEQGEYWSTFDDGKGASNITITNRKFGSAFAFAFKVDGDFTKEDSDALSLPDSYEHDGRIPTASIENTLSLPILVFS